MVPVAEAMATVPPSVGVPIVAITVSFGSTVVSGIVVTVKLALVWPTAKVRLPPEAAAAAPAPIPVPRPDTL
ncbi:hypothetical protein MPOCJGCO_3454 [Methylobacterium trifolii]|uniref:Uncharacterized protein n=1 Tax=Methylobacterium trifolii TaxID=1003092 RepID=A0ABQ4U3B3_9HYPH|nr:hypothetical protein MPOCJGCO_3454 [Methylobacterium trifolii]